MIDADWAFDRYEEIRNRLPGADFPAESRRAANLAETFDDFDAYVLDGFGVLNVGGTAIPGAVERVAEMRAAGKHVLVLSNAATLPTPAVVKKYQALGFDFTADEIVTSRDVALAALSSFPAGLSWGVAAAGTASMKGLPIRALPLTDDPQPYNDAEAVLLLSADDWTEERQAHLAVALDRRSKPVVVANPDVVAPRESGLTLEPGHFAHTLLDCGTSIPQFHGKPFPSAFEMVSRRLNRSAADPIAAERIAMVGDTLHTDILGGAAAGWGTVLVTDHGLFKGRDVAPYIERSGIVPTVIVPTT